MSAASSQVGRLEANALAATSRRARFVGRSSKPAIASAIPGAVSATMTASWIASSKPCVPTLVVTTEESGLATVDATRAWQEQIAGSELVVLPGNSYHVAATHADQSAAATLEFIGRRGG